MASPPLQLRFALEREPSYAREAFVTAPSNAAAITALDAWPAWPDGVLVLVGPAGSGKTHLAMSWAERTGAAVLPKTWADADPAAFSGAMLLEDAGAEAGGEPLFHLLNIAARPGSTLLITARTRPNGWPAEVPDLRSRLNALTVAELQAPDDIVLAGIMEKLFRERSITPSDDLIPYLIRRIERSAERAQEIVARLDELGHLEGRAINRALARQALNEGSEEGCREED